MSLQEATEITSEDSEALRRAVKSLEHPSLAGRLTNLVGKPVELIGYTLPSFASKAIASATSKGLEAALKVALRTLLLIGMGSRRRSASQAIDLPSDGGVNLAISDSSRSSPGRDA